MILAKHKLTVINTYTEPGTWVPPFPPSGDVIKNVVTVIQYGQWEDITSRNSDNTGKNFIDKTISIIIPLKAKTTNNRKFIRAAEYTNIATNLKDNYWTVDIGSEMFFGEVPEITTQYTIEQARKDFRYCQIKSIDDLTKSYILPHWELVGI
jgi:hypothetical protein